MSFCHATPAPFLSFVPTFAGAIVVGSLVNLCLHGVLCVQVYTYYLSFPRDRLAFKFLVYGTFAIEIAQSALVTHDTYVRIGKGFGSVGSLLEINLIWLSMAIFGGIVGCICQLFFAHRIWVLAGSRVVACLVVLLTFLGVAGAMIAGTTVFLASSFLDLMVFGHAGVFSISVAIWTGCCAAADVIVAARMSYFLVRQDTVFRSTRIMTLRLIRLTIETGLLTASVAVVAAALLFSLQHQTLSNLIGIYFVVPMFCVSKFYSNTLLVTLNNRMRIRGGRRDCDHDHDNNTPSQMQRWRQRKQSTPRSTPSIMRIDVQREVHTVIDISPPDHVEVDDSTLETRGSHAPDKSVGA